VFGGLWGMRGHMIERTLMCVSCDSEYTIEYDEDAVAGKDCYCPFCGFEIDIVEETFEDFCEKDND